VTGGIVLKFIRDFNKQIDTMNTMNTINPNNRYAYEWNTLPRYVYQNEQGEWANFERDIVMLPQVVNPVEYYQTVNENAQVPMNLSVYDMCLFYVFANAAFQKYIQSLELNTFYYRTDYNLDDETEAVIQQLVQQVYNPQAYQELLGSIQRSKLQFRAGYEQDQRELESIQAFGSVDFTPFVVESVSIQYKLNDLLVQNIYAFFDQCTLSERFPLAVTPRFYKVLKGYEYTLDIPTEECMYLFSYMGRIELYSDKLSFTFNKGEDDSEYVQEICQCLGFNPETLVPMQQKLNGSCLYPRQPLNLMIWRDLVMNQPYISKFLVIDEHALNVRNPRRKALQIYYFEPSTQNRTTMTMKIDEDGVRLKILNASETDVKVIQSFMSTALAMYNSMGPSIAEEYNTILGSDIVQFVVRPPVAEIDYNKPLKVIAPEMFLPNYTRKCGYLPRIVPRETADEIEMKEGFQVMEFPKPTDSVHSVHSVQPLLFTCEQHRERGYIHPGLRLNPLDNKDKYPLLPCCYQDDQRLRNSLYVQYYGSEKSLSEFAKQPPQKGLQFRFLTSDKFVGLDQTGKCSEEIQQWFQIYTSEKPYRKGVHRTPQSALECVLTRLDINGFARKGSSARLNQLRNEWERLRTFKLEICAQECWNLPNPEEFLVNDQLYFDPRYMVRLLEYAYQCKIVIVGRTDFIHPNYIQGYLRWSPNPQYPVVVLYEHMGSESDEASYPQCEIIEFKPSDNEEKVYVNLHEDYLSSLETYIAKRSGNPVSITHDSAFFNALEEDYTLLQQHLDFYGKVYAINVLRKSDSVKMTLFFGITRVAPMHIDATQEVYYVPSLPQNLSSQRASIRIGEFDFYVYTQSEAISRLTTYDLVKMRTRLMVENAKRLYAISGNFDFIRVSLKDYQSTSYSKYVFIDSQTIPVPTEEVRQRLIQTLKLFETRYATQLKMYAEALTLPLEFETIQDFEVQSNVIIAPVNDTIQWFSSFFNLKPIDGTLYTDPFVCEIQNVIYKCVPISQIPEQWGSYRVLFPQIKRTFLVGENPDHTLLVIQNTQKVYQFYDCLIF
jgi:hypothetical protein